MSGPAPSRWFLVPALWRGTTLVACLTGLLTAPWGLPFLSTQTNLLVLGYLAYALPWSVRRRTSHAPAPLLRGGVTTAILLVGVISHWMFAGGELPFAGLVVADPEQALLNWSAFLIHWVVPGCMLIDWVAFGPHRQVAWHHAVWWIAYPIAYALVTLLRSVVFPPVFARYPVDLFDPRVAGWGGVVLGLLPLVALTLALAAVVWGLDWLAGTRTRDRDLATR
ncbi:Pr6Pr family membrane protein [Serinicoccus kebangsaanensis]|uniref:Pr6Pr family membrane protein n=1 Tax=Serinicoccus kebangsaanensis TaxID=2602069 RepID=UPI00124E0327|nr:Pr6Pr family membrane protein [Serinicoccus kebangsaanensis]